ncbi:MAG: hypothetical protein WCA19_25505, partial [Candidatus Acidiferrales bacterium]
MQYLEKVDTISRAIRSEVFYRRPGKWCRQCEYLPVCTGDERKIRSTLVQLSASQKIWLVFFCASIVR